VPDSRYRRHLPQLDDRLFLTDGGCETSLIFHDGIDLPLFASFTLLRDDEGTEALRRYFRPYAQLAADNGTGFVLETPTWRASPRWAKELDISDEELDHLNRKAIGLMEELREEFEADTPFVISGNIGPQDDGYSPETILSADEAEEYHSTQINTFADTAADLVTVLTMTYADEAIGIARAAKSAGIPAVIGFTTETDGRLPDGQALGDAIGAVESATDRYPAYYMINCAHPTHFESVLHGDDWVERVRGLRANASMRSHAELDEAEDLDDGDPQDLAARYGALRDKLPALNVVGGCCGTDHRHVSEICSVFTSSRS